MKSRVNLGKIAPEPYAAMGELENRVREFAKSAGISEGMVHLLKLRASQINECAFCVRMHARDAIDSGESNDRVALTAAWEESEYFDKKERASFALIEAITLIAEGQVPDSVYSEAARVLDEKEIAAVEWIGIAINAWNRIAIPSRYPVKP
ncbi:MAG: carboxymuconolactone decarboxylase family protein [Candidatus Omnitrophica bacterium]|nr:carboxymuconolactone decarboxylase family protein [Candidatus Omnitrophota bacterium]